MTPLTLLHSERCFGRSEYSRVKVSDYTFRGHSSAILFLLPFPIGVNFCRKEFTLLRGKTASSREANSLSPKLSPFGNSVTKHAGVSIHLSII